MNYIEFTPEEIRQIILGKDVIIRKCPDCVGKGYELVGTGENEKYPDAEVFMANEEELEDDWYYRDMCETCDGVGYLIDFLQ